MLIFTNVIIKIKDQLNNTLPFIGIRLLTLVDYGQ